MVKLPISLFSQLLTLISGFGFVALNPVLISKQETAPGEITFIHFVFNWGVRLYEEKRRKHTLNNSSLFCVYKAVYMFISSKN